MEVHCVQLVLLSWHYLLLTGSRIATDLDPEWKCSRTTAGTIQYHCTVEWEKPQKLENPDEWSIFFSLFYQKVRSLPLQIFICLSTILVAHIRLCVDIKPSLRFDCHFWFCSRCDGKTLWCLFVWSVHFAVWRLQGWHRSVTRSWSGFVLSGEVWEVLSKFCSKWICMNIVKADACEGIIYTILFWQTSRLVGI